MARTVAPHTKISGGSFLLEERQTADVFTPEDFSEQHQMIGQTTEEFAVNEILPNAEKIVRSARNETASGVSLRLSIRISWPSPPR